LSAFCLRRNSRYLFAAVWLIPIHWLPAGEVEMASTVWAVFLDFEREVE